MSLSGNTLEIHIQGLLVLLKTVHWENGYEGGLSTYKGHLQHSLAGEMKD